MNSVASMEVKLVFSIKSAKVIELEVLVSSLIMLMFGTVTLYDGFTKLISQETVKNV